MAVASNTKDVYENAANGEPSKMVRNVDKNILDAFWKLSNANKHIRISSAFAIIRTLHNKQRDVSNALNAAKSSDLIYALERLVKGMCSSHSAARHGFAVSLTEVLRIFREVSIEEVLLLVEKYLPVSNRKEKGPMVVGQLLVYSAIVKSGRLASDSSVLPLVVKAINELSSERNYIQPASCALLLEIFSQITEASFKEYIWTELKEILSCGWELCSPYTLWLLLVCQRKFSDTVTPRFLEDKWGCECIVCEKNYDFLKKSVKKSTVVHPQLHPLCSELLLCIFKSKGLKRAWNCLIDENLFESGQNERAYLGFQLVKEVLSQDSSFVKETGLTLNNNHSRKMVKSVLSSKFSLIFVKSLVSNSHPLHHIAEELASVLGTCVKSTTDSKIHIAVINTFLHRTRATFLQQLLNRKEFGTIIMNLSPDAVKNYLEILKTVALGTEKNGDEENEASLNQQRCLAVVQIGNLVSHPATICDIEWRIEVTKLLLLHSFFIIKEPTDDISQCNIDINPLPDAVKLAFSHAFAKALDSLSRKTDNNFTSLQQLCSSLLSIVEYCQHLLQSPSHVSLTFSVEKITESWGKMWITVQKLTKRSKKGGLKSEISVFFVLFLHLGLHLLSDPEYIPNILEELQICYKKALKAKKVNKGKETDIGPTWIHVLVDLMLSLLSQSSHHLRRVVGSAFSLLCPFMTMKSLQQILDVVIPEKATEEDLLVEGSEVDNEEDVEFHSGSSSDENDRENDVKDISALNELKQKLQKVLGPAADGSDEESDAVLTDEEMFELDEALSDAFRARKKVGHSRLTSEQETLLNFRLRCLDLIAMYLKSDPPMHLAIKCILPILSTYVYGKKNRLQQALSEKARSVLSILLKTKKFQHCKEVQEDEVDYIFDELFQRAKKDTSADIKRILYSLCVYVILCQKKLNLLPENAKNQEDKLSKFFKQYLTALDDFVKLDHIHPQMFTVLMSACPEKAWEFVQPLQEYAFDPNIRLFKQALCLGLLSSAIRFSKSQKSISSYTWLETLKTLMPKVIEALKNVLSEHTDNKVLYTTELLDVIVTINGICQEKCDKTLIEEYKDLIPVLTNINDMQRKNLGKKGNKLKYKVITLLGGEVLNVQRPSKKKQKTQGSEQKPKKRKLK